MANTDLLYLVQWEDRFMSVISARDIVYPVRQNYEEGALISAKYNKKTYQAVISEIHPNRKFLLQQSKLPPKHSYVSQTSSHNIGQVRQALSVPPHETVLLSSSQHKERVATASQQKEPVPTSSQHKEPVATSSQTKEPVATASHQKEPVATASHQKEPVATSSQSKEPVATSGHHKEPVATSGHHKEPVATSSQHKEPVATWEDKLNKSKYKRKELSCEEECKSLRRKMRKLEDRVLALEEKGRTCNSQTEDERALDLVRHLPSSDIGEIIRILARHFFSEEELKGSSRTGKKTVKSGDTPRPPLNREKFQILERLVMDKAGISKEIFFKKFDNYQKVLRRK